MTTELELPNNKGPVRTASDSDLEFWGPRISKKLKEEPNHRWADKDKAILAAIRQELRSRKGGAKTPRKQTSTAIQHASVDVSLVGAIADPKSANARLQEAMKECNLITPATAVGTIPEGCEVQFTIVSIPPTDPNLYSAGGSKKCLDHYHLLQILNALGGSIVRSVRIDDGSHPHYCSVLVGVVYKLFDGTEVYREKTAELDVREPHGAKYVEIVEKARKEGRDPSNQLLELRKFLYAQTESRALNRAIAACGVRRAYEPKDLEKPFMVARISFTGHSDDPEARAQFRAAIANNFLGGSRALYGRPAEPQAPRLAPPPPPPAEQQAQNDDWLWADGEEQESSPEAAPPVAAGGAR